MNVSGHTPPSPVDITTCDREPIHIPGAIQPHGFLLALDAATWRVRYASENVGDYLRIDATVALGRSVEELFGQSIVAALREAAAHPLFTQRALFVAYVRAEGQRSGVSFSLLAHRPGRGSGLTSRAGASFSRARDPEK